MLFSRCIFRETFAGVALLLAIGLAGCGDFCIAGYSAPGNGGTNPIVTTASGCTFRHTNTMLRVVALTIPVCKTCSNAARVEHVFVTLQDIQIRSDAEGDTSSPVWLEVAPQLVHEPRQIDLMGDAASEVLVENAIVPAGTYSEVRLRIFVGSPAGIEKPALENACGDTGWNCIVMGNGQTRALRLPSDAPELLIPLQSVNGGSFQILPDTQVELQLSLQPQQLAYTSGLGDWKPQFVLTGHATVEPQAFSAVQISSQN